MGAVAYDDGRLRRPADDLRRAGALRVADRRWLPLFALVAAAAASLFVREAEAQEERRERDFEQRVLRELAEQRAQLRGGGKRPR